MNHVRITSMSIEQLPRLIPLLEMSAQKPYRYLLNELCKKLDSLWFYQLEEAIKNGLGQNFVVMGQDRVLGLILYTNLPWETRIFNKKMGSISHFIVDPTNTQKDEIAGLLLDQAINWAISNGIEFLLCKTYTDDIFSIHSLESKGFLLMDSLLDYIYDFSRYSLEQVVQPSIPEGYTIRPSRENDEKELIFIARESFQSHFGRFHADERIPKQLATQVYEEWVNSSIHGYADWIRVAEIRGRIAGFSIWKKPSQLELKLNIQVGHYSLCGIHPDYHRKGLFSILTYDGMKLFNGLASCIEGPTHINNYPVQRGYDKLDWKISDARHSFHKWLSVER
jgi:hypothetical protein